jgi:GTP cyclohydrolase I
MTLEEAARDCNSVIADMRQRGIDGRMTELTSYETEAFDVEGVKETPVRINDMSFLSTLRSLRRDRRPVERALAAASTAMARDELVLAARIKSGSPPRL